MRMEQQEIDVPVAGAGFRVDEPLVARNAGRDSAPGAADIEILTRLEFYPS